MGLVCLSFQNIFGPWWSPGVVAFPRVSREVRVGFGGRLLIWDCSKKVGFLVMSIILGMRGGLG